MWWHQYRNHADSASKGKGRGKEEKVQIASIWHSLKASKDWKMVRYDGNNDRNNPPW
jgi:hypothetical protein